MVRNLSLLGWRRASGHGVAVAPPFPPPRWPGGAGQIHDALAMRDGGAEIGAADNDGDGVPVARRLTPPRWPAARGGRQGVSAS